MSRWKDAFDAAVFAADDDGADVLKTQPMGGGPTLVSGAMVMTLLPLWSRMLWMLMEHLVLIPRSDHSTFKVSLPRQWAGLLRLQLRRARASG